MKSSTTLDRLIDPASIAVIGATQNRGKIGKIVFELLLTSGCKLYPVHPDEKEVF